MAIRAPEAYLRHEPVDSEETGFGLNRSLGIRGPDIRKGVGNIFIPGCALGESQGPFSFSIENFLNPEKIKHPVTTGATGCFEMIKF